MNDAPSVDVAIVGAGPGGLHAAIAASQRGVSVAVFDKKSTIGTPVKCGEYFPNEQEMRCLLPHATDFTDLFEIPRVAISNECDTLRIFSPFGKSFEFPFHAHVLDRTVLEQTLARYAERLGAFFRLNCSVRLFIRDGEVYVGSTQADSVHAGVVISADGFPSSVAALAGLADDRYRLTKNVAINYQYVMNGLEIESNVTEMFMGGSVAPGGYAWIIPKARSVANVGIGFRVGFAKSRRGKDYLDYFVGRHPIASQKLRNGAIQTMIADILPVDGATSRTYSESCLVAGDSAGMVMATNGGGIPTAMVAGRIAGEVAADHVLKHTPLSDYEARWKTVLGEELRASARMRRFADAFMRHDRALDLAMLLLGTAGIKKVVTCKIPGGLEILLNLLGY